ncbi:golgi snare bet1-related [Anaeramoeba flamelloides]|uniref:Golgi snare bet1-related n=1 Tax=Anaeramoeba flamelloides TaxID=1746091 RepID=A0AAV8A982_9EUKA|nr:golgi snare bet1-related [Anaeramoeba flamelloides]KAJ6250790.1 golgi snare bet1-related [Anaeramoeba flamelloides]
MSKYSPIPQNYKRKFGSSQSSDNIQTNQYNEEFEGMMENQNNEIIDELESKTNLLKSYADGINDEVGNHLNILEGLDSDFDNAGNSMNGTMSKLNEMVNIRSPKRICLIALAIFFLFVLLYFWITHDSGSEETNETMN